ncbi:hypothetical protein [Aquimarina brevivitae]|uniref:Uncharacterized protein n=1 Tax=Aquimarina brevivitae TaxID=323412 RepID=A0A4Q7NTS9_9FLAO|nr:hypothetical protein [Aquimarina brevivitae]RZS90571.1 hypothetical protein EV197_3365 [Aquimarina brevivitae]
MIQKDFIPLFICLVLLIFSIGDTLFTDYVLDYKFFLGLGLILISTVLYFKAKRIYIYIFILTLLLGLMNIIELSHVSVVYSIGFGTSFITFNPVFLGLLILFFVCSKGKLNELFPNKEITDTELANEKLAMEKRIKGYELKFQSKSESELQNIADQNSKYVKEAKIAAKRILGSKTEL